MDALPPLSDAENRRYLRHLVLPEVGDEGQRRLKAARVLLVGAGGLGAPAGLYLAAAGVGRLGIVDFDAVETSNLQRQVLFGTDDVGAPKAETAAARLRALNPEIDVRAHPVRLAAANALEILRGYDVVVDGSDNFPARYLVNDACALLGLPDVYGSVFRFEGQASVFWRGRGPCYRCLHPEPPPAGDVPNCAEGGVLGVLPGVVGAIQATEAIKIVLSAGEPLIGRLLLYDGLTSRFREMALAADPDCALCGKAPRVTALSDLDDACAIPALPESLSAAALRDRLARGERPVLLDVRTPQEWAICRLEGATLVPIAALPSRLDELDPAAETIVYCHVGARSAMALRFLKRAGFTRVAHLEGGIDAWSASVDPSVPRY